MRTAAGVCWLCRRLLCLREPRLREPLWSTSVRTPRCPARADLYAALTAKLGPDPLREDADAERVWARMQASRKPVGLVLMDQSMIAGIGNIYRAEILFKARAAPGAHGKARPTRLSAPAQLSKRQRGSARFEVGSTPGGPPGGRRACTPSRRPARWTNAGWAAGRQAGVHPEQAANTVERGAFERIWAHSVELLRRGFQSGSILTVDPDEAKRLGKPWTRRRAPPAQPPALGAGIRQLRQTRGGATCSMASGCVPCLSKPEEAATSTCTRCTGSCPVSPAMHPRCRGPQLTPVSRRARGCGGRETARRASCACAAHAPRCRSLGAAPRLPAAPQVHLQPGALRALRRRRAHVGHGCAHLLRVPHLPAAAGRGRAGRRARQGAGRRVAGQGGQRRPGRPVPPHGAAACRSSSLREACLGVCSGCLWRRSQSRCAWRAVSRALLRRQPVASCGSQAVRRARVHARAASASTACGAARRAGVQEPLRARAGRRRGAGAADDRAAQGRAARARPPAGRPQGGPGRALCRRARRGARS